MVLKCMRDTAVINTTSIFCRNLGRDKCEMYFVCAEIRIIMRRLSTKNSNTMNYILHLTFTSIA